MKQCCTCNLIKNINEFSKNKYHKDGHTTKCKNCFKLYRIKNKEKTIINTKLWNKLNYNHLKEYQKNYYNINKDKFNTYYKLNNIKIKEKQKEYRKLNPGIINSKTAKRHSEKLKRTPPWLTKQQLNEIADFYKQTKELEKIFGKKFEVDHIIPLQGKEISGLHVPWNLQILTRKENRKKRNKIN